MINSEECHFKVALENNKKYQIEKKAEHHTIHFLRKRRAE